jgi:uncharacterized protein (DUF427 family)
MTDAAQSDAHRITIEPATGPMRVLFAGEVIAESAAVKVMFEGTIPARYYFPQADVAMDKLTATATSTHCPFKGDANYWRLKVGDSEAEDAVWSYLAPIPAMAEIAGLLCFYDAKVDAIEAVNAGEQAR